MSAGFADLWRPGAAVAASSPLRVDLCGMTDYIPAESWCISTTLAGLTARLRIEAREDNRVVIDAGTYGRLNFTLDELPESRNMLVNAVVLHEYPRLFSFGMDVKINCEFGAIGLSSSSSVAGIYNAALGLICGEPHDPLLLARQTQAIEPHWYGRQDQLAVAFGGLNLWHMTPGAVADGAAVSFGDIERYPITMPGGLKEELANECFLIYDSGIEEGAHGVLEKVAAGYDTDPAIRYAFEDMNSLAREVGRILSKPSALEDWLAELGSSFNAIRAAHERLHPSVTNDRMRALFSAAENAGALGGRYSGAGGRGALTFICRPCEIARLIAALDAVSTPHIAPDGRAFTRGRQIHFGGFGDARATAWYAA